MIWDRDKYLIWAILLLFVRTHSPLKPKLYLFLVKMCNKPIPGISWRAPISNLEICDIKFNSDGNVLHLAREKV